MSLTLEFTIREDFLYAKADGHFTKSAAKEVFHQCVDRAKQESLARLLCDIRRVKAFDAGTLSLADRYDVGVFVATAKPAHLKLAVLGTGQQIPLDGFDETVMVNRGAFVKTTTDLHKALDWLGVTASARCAQ
jgi:hypothetical protein